MFVKQRKFFKAVVTLKGIEESAQGSVSPGELSAYGASL